MVTLSDENKGKVAVPCDHNAELYYSSIFDENVKETRVKRCAKCHSIVQYNVSKQSVSGDSNKSFNRSARRY